jgi:UDP-galactose transporter B1
MGRQKQPTPLQRAPSSSLMHMPPNEAEAVEKTTNGSANVPSTANGSASAKATTAQETVETPGLMQLLICVLGIYAAL